MNITSKILNVIFGTIAIFQFWVMLQDALTSSELYSEMTIVPLSSPEFPLRLSVCVSPGHHQAHLQEAGYQDYVYYQYGQSKYNSSLFGWAGHTKDGNSKYADVGLLQKRLIMFSNLSDIVQSFIHVGYSQWDTITDKEKLNSLVETSRYYFSQFCFTLKPNIKVVPGITVYLHNNLSITEAEIVISDKMLFSGRTIIAHTLNHEGRKIKLNYEKDCQACYGKRFGIKINQEVFDIEDLTKNCTTYPTADFKDYNECDQQKGIATLEGTFGNGFTPLWASDNTSKVTAKPSFGVNKAINNNFANGRLLSDCLLPCTITKTTTTHHDDFTSPHQGISLYIKDQMPVTTTTFVSFSLSKFLSDLGGILGLWLGLGVVQLLELVFPRINIQCVRC